MTVLRAIATELLGLFLDDGNLALFTILLVAVIGGLAVMVPAHPAVWGALLVVGCLVALAESTLRAGRR